MQYPTPMLVGAAALLLAATALPQPATAPADARARPIVPVPGSLVLTGGTAPPDCVLDAFLHLAGGRTANVRVLTTRPGPAIVERLRSRGALDVAPLQPASGSRAPDTATLLEYLHADAIWLDTAPPEIDANLPTALLRNVLLRGGALGASGETARELCAARLGGDGDVLLPGVDLRCGGTDDPPPPAAGVLQILIDADSAVLIHGGRRLCGYGSGSVRLRVAGSDAGWPALGHGPEVVDVFDPGDVPPYSLDLLAWLRTARDHGGPRFPMALPAAPELAQGTLVLSGGGGVSEDTFAAFIAAAGGTDAPLVCIPSAQAFDAGEDIESYSADALRRLGCTDVTILHIEDPRVADHDQVARQPLRAARGVWIDGGRTFRFMDRFEGTECARLIRAVLTRDGVVGGSSAGCQVCGEFLVRGDPRNNRTLVQPGYTRGLGLLPGTVFDAHFLQRDRHEPFLGLVQRHPQLLGIGVDEDTAVLVRGRQARVLGSGQVSFYDLRADGDDQVLRLRAGQRYDLVERRPPPR